jgi:hypothetical protein
MYKITFCCSKIKWHGTPLERYSSLPFRTFTSQLTPSGWGVPKIISPWLPPPKRPQKGGTKSAGPLITLKKFEQGFMFYDMTQESCVVFVGIGHLGQTSTNIGGIFLFFFSCSHCVPMGFPKFSRRSFKTFTRVSQIYSIWFAQSSTLICI